ncbi:hypothetical protein [Streptomyces sp. NPDC058572]|uniref:hypothetical protein n=1 Tax=Streptomyces sp. NPDC058572 TaxID=3346546 RepID=UPI00365FAE21
MSTKFPAIDRDKSPLVDADALRGSPHIIAAATWKFQDLPLRQHAQAVARSLTR